jgi:hypothetical protein
VRGSDRPWTRAHSQSGARRRLARLRASARAAGFFLGEPMWSIVSEVSDATVAACADHETGFWDAPTDVARHRERLTRGVAKPVEYETRAGETPGQHVRCREHAFSRQSASTLGGRSKGESDRQRFALRPNRDPTGRVREHARRCARSTAMQPCVRVGRATESPARTVGRSTSTAIRRQGISSRFTLRPWASEQTSAGSTWLDWLQLKRLVEPRSRSVETPSYLWRMSPACSG